MAKTETPVTIQVAGRTTEEVLRELAANPQTDPLPAINALVARFDARAARREAKASAE